jgi:anti-sigma regulatory factor (Ser/Thr protein kinase)
MEGMSTRRRRFDRDPDNVRAVRSFVSEEASRSGADPDTAALLASEFATKAVLHAHGTFEIRVPETGLDVFRVEIVNDAPEMVAAVREPSATGGRGLHIGDTLSRRWGTEVLGDQKVVWFELPASPNGR